MWFPIPTFDGYFVSRCGQIRSTRHGRDFVMSQKTSRRHGYRDITMWDNDGRRRTCRVHRLVAEVFIGAQPEGHQVNHKNLVKTDNRASNLEWVTQAQNMEHARQHLGEFRAKGERHSQAKLTDAQVARIRQLRRGLGMRQATLAELFGVTPGCISMILAGKRRVA